MKKSLLAGSALLAGLLSLPAYAANNRTWVSGKGIDQTGCGTVASPCRTLQYAHDNTNAGGEIDVMDGAGFGSLVIAKSISVVNDGAGVAGLLVGSANPAITVNAQSTDTVLLSGLTIDGPGTGVSVGILYNSGGSLLVTKCLIQHAFHGIDIEPNTGPKKLSVSDTTLAYNLSSGINVSVVAPGDVAQLDVDRVTASFNKGSGVNISNNMGPTPPVIRAKIANSVFNGNETGVNITGNASITATVDLSEISNNGDFGISNIGGNLYLGRSVITGNNFGFLGMGAGGNYSYGDNRINGNKLSDTQTSLVPVAQK